MTLGEKIRKFRKIREATQLDLGYHVKLSPLRVGQYETGKRNPKQELINKFAAALDIEPIALYNPNYDTVVGLMHALFDFEDTFNLTIEEDYSDGEEDYIFRFRPKDPKLADELREAFATWYTAQDKYLANPQIKTKEELKYDQELYSLWKAQYPNNSCKDPHNGMTICRETCDWKL